MIQNSPEWERWRLGGIGASEISAIIGVDRYSNTPHSVWLVKSKRSKGFEGNSFTVHGQETEAKARARYELVSMEDMPPACATHPKYQICRASLDGLRADNKLILELKCPTGRDTLDTALAGRVPDHYWPQVQYQLAVTGADMCHFFVYHSDSGEHALVEVLPDIEYQGELIAAALEFWEKFVIPDIPPPLTEKDVKIIEDDKILADLCTEIIEGKDRLPKPKLDSLKARAVEMSGHNKFKCGRVQFSAVNRNGKFSFHKLTIQEHTA
jgi:putative phage-type endonuclease